MLKELPVINYNPNTKELIYFNEGDINKKELFDRLEAIKEYIPINIYDKYKYCLESNNFLEVYNCYLHVRRISGRREKEIYESINMNNSNDYIIEKIRKVISYKEFICKPKIITDFNKSKSINLNEKEIKILNNIPKNKYFQIFPNILIRSAELELRISYRELKKYLYESKNIKEFTMLVLLHSKDYKIENLNAKEEFINIINYLWDNLK